MNNDYPFKNELLINHYSSIVFIILAGIIGNNDKITSASRKEEVTLLFIELVDEYFKKERSLEFYANQLNISIKYLSNCVRDTTKAPPTKIIADAIINQAKLLLLNRKTTINQISEELGFVDQFVFGKFFKNHTGYSPKNYRSQNDLVDTF